MFDVRVENIKIETNHKYEVTGKRGKYLKTEFIGLEG